MLRARVHPDRPEDVSRRSASGSWRSCPSAGRPVLRSPSSCPDAEVQFAVDVGQHEDLARVAADPVENEDQVPLREVVEA